MSVDQGKLLLSAAFALCIGAVQIYIPGFLLPVWYDLLPEGSPFLQPGNLNTAAALIIVVLGAVPSAFLLSLLQPKKMWLYLPLAVFGYSGYLGWKILPTIQEIGWWAYVQGQFPIWIQLPLAVLLIRGVGRWVSPNKSLNTDASEAGAG